MNNEEVLQNYKYGFTANMIDLEGSQFTTFGSTTVQQTCKRFMAKVL